MKIFKGLLLAVFICVSPISVAMAADTPSSPPVAAVESEQAYLYATGEEQAVLKYQGITGTFNWVTTSPRLIAPDMRVFDYDQDGAKEVAVSLDAGSGTGASIYALHIVTVENNSLVDHEFMANDYNKQIAENVACQIVSEKDKMLVKLSAPQGSVSADITSYAKEFPAKASDIKLLYGDIAEFGLEDNGVITLYVPLGVVAPDTSYIFYIADLRASVNYSNGKFTLADIKITESEDSD